jgi:hypothetical protein
MQKLITAILLGCTFVACAQTDFNYKRDFANILTRTKSSNDVLSYKKLLTRFSACDTTLTDFDVLALLIGFTAKPAYNPYGTLDEEGAIYNLNGEGKFQEALERGLKFLKTHPVAEKTLIEVSYAYHKLGKEDLADNYMWQGDKIFKAMHFSGEGTGVEHPTFALGPTDGQDYIHKFVRADIGTMGSGSDKDGNFVDILEAKFKDGKTLTFYFVIEHATKKMFSGFLK